MNIWCKMSDFFLSIFLYSDFCSILILWAIFVYFFNYSIALFLVIFSHILKSWALIWWKVSEVSMSLNESQWVLVSFGESKRVLMSLGEAQWVLVRLNESWWVSLTLIRTHWDSLSLLFLLVCDRFWWFDSSGKLF